MAADVDALLVGWLSSALGVRCVTELPGNLEQVLPIVQVARSGGGDSALSFEEPVIDVDCYAANRSAASLLARKAHDALTYRLPGHFAGGVLVARVETISGPSWAYYDNSALRRFTAAYSLTVKSSALLP